MMSYTRSEKLKAVLYTKLDGNWAAGHLFEDFINNVKNVIKLFVSFFGFFLLGI